MDLPWRKESAPNNRQVFCCWPISYRRWWWVSCARFYRYSNSKIFILLYSSVVRWNSFLNVIVCFSMWMAQFTHDVGCSTANNQLPIDCIRKITISSHFGCNLYFDGIGFGRGDATINISRLQQVSLNVNIEREQIITVIFYRQARDQSMVIGDRWCGHFRLTFIRVTYCAWY